MSKPKTKWAFSLSVFNEQVSDCCLLPIDPSFCESKLHFNEMMRKSTLYFTNTVGLLSVSSLKQQSARRYFTSLWNTSPIPKLPIFAYSSIFIVNQVVIRLETLDHHSSLGPTGHVKKSYHFASIYDQKSKMGTTQNVV